MPEVRHFLAGVDLAGQRLDVALTRLAPELSRARVQRLLGEGRVRIAGREARPSARLRGGEVIELEVVPEAPATLLAQDLPLRVLYEDRDLVVLDKAAGMVVHPARGAPHSTVVNALLHRLAPEFGASPGLAGPGAGVRLGLVHRLDKETSGCLAVAKSERALQSLQAAFRERSVEKVYLALCHGRLPSQGRLETTYGRHPRDRTRFTSRGKHARRALTEWKVREAFGEIATLAEVRLHTGRTHQIRVHLAESGHPILADATYGGRRREARLPVDHPARRAAEAVGRQALHAWKLGFPHPSSGQPMVFEAPLPPDIAAALAILRGS
jgi:23S rRNA pseudouridine1911/1915/1917 synthase